MENQYPIIPDDSVYLQGFTIKTASNLKHHIVISEVNKNNEKIYWVFEIVSNEYIPIFNKGNRDCKEITIKGVESVTKKEVIEEIDNDGGFNIIEKHDFLNWFHLKPFQLLQNGNDWAKS